MSASAIPSREKLIARARKMKAEIEQMYADAAHWNRMHPNVTPIDPDPDGKLAGIKHGIEAMLAEEEGRMRS